MHKFIAQSSDNGRKLIKYISSLFKKLPEGRIYRLFRQKSIKVNNKRIADSNYVVKTGDEIIIYGIKDEPSFVIYDNSWKLDSEIVYEDDNILLINKKAGTIVHGDSNCLDNQVFSYFKFRQNSAFRPSHVGRLDKWTSGLIMYAKNYQTLTELNHKTEFLDKIYVLKSDYNPHDEIVSVYIHHDELQQKMVATKNMQHPNDKIAKTRFFKKDNKLYAQLFTGRKHQIRATLEYLGYPIYGDSKYGSKTKGTKRVYLHCYKLKFNNLERSLEYLNGKEFECKEEW